MLWSSNHGHGEVWVSCPCICHGEPSAASFLWFLILLSFQVLPMAPVSSSPLARLTSLSLATRLLGSFLYSPRWTAGDTRILPFQVFSVILKVCVCGMYVWVQASLQTTKGVIPLWTVSCEPSAVAMGTKLGSFARAQYPLLISELDLKLPSTIFFKHDHVFLFARKDKLWFLQGSVCDCGWMDMITRLFNINQAQQLWFSSQLG